ncbi:retrotransposon protein, putative, ty1-copia subclass [Tanacetum coccineum]
MDGKVHTYKARLVAKGCTQTYGIDYEETFSPVADIRAIRILIAITAYYDYEIWQMDVKTAFLNGRLDEDIYMEQPEGYVDPNYPNGWRKKQPNTYMKKVPYASAVGSIMYLVRCTRPDVAFAQNLEILIQKLDVKVSVMRPGNANKDDTKILRRVMSLVVKWRSVDGRAKKQTNHCNACKRNLSDG